MGRPRKHRTVEAAESQTACPHPTEAPKQEPLPMILPDFEFDSTIGMDLDLSFLDMNNMDMNFLEIADPNTQFPPAPNQTGMDQGATGYTKLPQHVQASNGFWPMSHNLADINFDEPVPSSTPPPAPEITQEDLAEILSAEAADSLPSLSPPSSNSPSTNASPESDSAKTCNCLSSLYLALESLRALPKEVGQAMRVARTATKAAHDTILCPVCGDPPLDHGNNPPMQSFQNMMMLGALLPSVSSAYMRILTMVDAEAAAADADRRKLTFTIKGYGGLWGWMVRIDPSSKCGSADRLEGAVLEPALWRLTVRALLKIDVYGINEETPGISETGARQPGLKDIINMMEERSRRRHQQVDALVQAGVVQMTPSCHYVPLSDTTDKPTCLRIIDIAKRSMDDLVIP